MVRKLTDQDKEEIKRRWKEGEKGIRLAVIYGVDKGLISRIVNDKEGEYTTQHRVAQFMNKATPNCRTIKLGHGGQIRVIIETNLFELEEEERTFIEQLVDTIRAYEQHQRKE